MEKEINNTKQIPDNEQVGIYVQENKRKFIGIGIFMVMAVNLFSGGAISAIMPKMVEKMGGMELYGMVFTIGTIAMALSAPISGKMGDMYGKSKMFFLGSIVSIVSTFAIGLSPSMEVVVALRAISGVGNAFALCLGLVIIGSIFPSAQRIKWMGFYGTTNSIASMLGPVVGGVLADTIGWQWVFFVTLPVGVIGLIIVLKLMPKVTESVAVSKFDTSGTVLFGFLLVGFMMLCQWGGTKFSWLSWQIGAMIVALIIIAIIFVNTEKKKGESALMPMTLMGNPVFTTSFISIILTTASTLAIYMYLALYMQTVMGASATAAALPVTIQSIVALFGSSIFGAIVAKFGAKAIKPSALLGVLIAGGVNLVYALFITPETTVFFVYGVQVIYGVGATIIMVVYHMAVQNLLPKEQMSIATSTIQMGQTLGASVGLAIFGAVLNVSTDIVVSLKWVFMTAAIISAIALVATLFMKTSND